MCINEDPTSQLDRVVGRRSRGVRARACECGASNAEPRETTIVDSVAQDVVPSPTKKGQPMFSWRIAGRVRRDYRG